jgi:hypothetical protein
VFELQEPDVTDAGILTDLVIHQQQDGVVAGEAAYASQRAHMSNRVDAGWREADLCPLRGRGPKGYQTSPTISSFMLCAQSDYGVPVRWLYPAIGSAVTVILNR